MTVQLSIERLRRDESLKRQLGLEWLDDEARAALRDSWLALWNEIPYDEDFHADCRSRLLRCEPLAVGRRRSRRLMQTPSDLVLVADPLEPDATFVSLSRAMPSLLWIRCDKTHRLLDQLEPYLGEESIPVQQLPRVVRIAKVLGIDDRELIERTIEYTELWMDDTPWASAFVDDPWLRVEGPLSMMEQTAWLREVADEHPGRFPAMSWRTLWSRGVLRVEQHPMGLWVFELRYQPARDGKVVDLVNEVCGSHLPRDLPVDLAASLLRGSSVDDIGLLDMRARGAALTDQLAVQCALHPGEPESYAALLDAARGHLDDEDVLAVVGELVDQYHHDALWFELAAITAGTPLGDNLKGYVAPRQERE